MQTIGRRQFLATVGATGVALATGRAFSQETPASKPNIIVVLADDLGYADVGFNGCKDIPTPSIDSIAQGGVRFTNGYVSCPVCSPTRAGLLTGRYQQRFGHEFNPGPQEAAQFGLPLDQITIADRLKAAGYATGIVGKWHLGSRPESNPTKRGFDEFFGFLPGAHPYIDPSSPQFAPIMRGTEVVEEKEYLTDAFGREAEAFVNRHKGEPFFLYFAPNAVHGPMHATAKYLQRFKDMPEGPRKTHAAMTSAMDDAVGRVMTAVRDAGREQDTLVFFLSDNGGPTKVNGSLNTPLRGDKGTMWEGGIRVPFAMRWPGKVKSGGVYENPVISFDIFATAVAASGGTMPSDRPMDGMDLVPYVAAGKEGKPHESLFWRMGPGRAARVGNLKLARQKDSPQDELYDLAVDVSESRNLAAERPEDLEKLRAAYAEWESRMVEPLWQPADRQKRAAKKQQPAPAV